jgi:cell shape-determining protein MreC
LLAGYRAGLIGNVQLLARVYFAGVATNGGLVGVINLVDVGIRTSAVELLGDLAQAIAGLDGIAGSTGFEVGANVHGQVLLG